VELRRVSSVKNAVNPWKGAADSPGEVKAPGGAKLGKQALVQSLEDTCL
jgi:hypothetical protein